MASADADLLAEGPSDWEDASAVLNWRDEIDEQYLDLAEPVLNDFLRRVRLMAEEALDAPVLTAAGRSALASAGAGASTASGKGRRGRIVR